MICGGKRMGVRSGCVQKHNIHIAATLVHAFAVID